ncbi:MAG TPA: C69 family dipeptidase, partial [Methanospirillum sp.]|uniref:dipeptidase n=1 Tax=Methanospirillum sp. TaxID=45200 RepID=UPI002C1652A3
MVSQAISTINGGVIIHHKTRLISFFLILMFICYPSLACTNFLVTKGASADGSVFVAHSNDGFGAGVVGPAVQNEVTEMIYVPPADHPPGSVRAVRYDPNSGSDEPNGGKTIETDLVAYIPEVSHTYGYYTGSYGIVNEHQLMFAECTDYTKVQPSFDKNTRIFYSSELSNIAAERTTTARDAVKLIGNLIDTYGFYGTGETLPIADLNEAWVIEISGGTPDGKGGLWVAQKIPDGTVFVAANTFRIRDVDPNNPDILYSKNLFPSAIANGWYSPSQEKLDWLKVVSGGEYSHPYYSLSRIWSIYNRVAPSLNLSPFVSDTYSRDYPFSVKPDKLLNLSDAFTLYRDHYEGTVFDLTKGEAAGPFGNPYRWRGTFDAHDLLYPGEIKPGAWPRPISETFTGYSYVIQGRSWLPDPVGGVVWFGFGPQSETVYMPFYAGGTAAPASFVGTNRTEFNRSSAYWTFNFVANWATINYRLISADIKEAQQKIEKSEQEKQFEIEKKAVNILQTNGTAACGEYLTNYSVTNSQKVQSDWWNLSDSLVAKYSNLMVTDLSTGSSTNVGYPDWWLEKTGYQYGPRIYDYQGLEKTQGLVYVNKTVNASPGNELMY